MSTDSVTYSTGGAQIVVPTSIFASDQPMSADDLSYFKTQPEGQESQSPTMTWVAEGVAQTGSQLTLYFGALGKFQSDAAVGAQQHDPSEPRPVPLEVFGRAVLGQRFDSFPPLMHVPREQLEKALIVSQRMGVWMEAFIKSESDRYKAIIQKLQTEVDYKNCMIDLQAQIPLGRTEFNNLMDIAMVNECQAAATKDILKVQNEAHMRGWYSRAARSGTSSSTIQDLLEVMNMEREGYEDKILQLRVDRGMEAADLAADRVQKFEALYTAKIQRLQRAPLVQNLRLTLKDKEETIVEQNKMIAGRDQRMAEKDEAIKNLTDEVAELKLQLAQAGVGESEEPARKRARTEEKSVCYAHLHGHCRDTKKCTRFYHPAGLELQRLRAELGIITATMGEVEHD